MRRRVRGGMRGVSWAGKFEGFYVLFRHNGGLQVWTLSTWYGGMVFLLSGHDIVDIMWWGLVFATFWF